LLFETSRETYQHIHEVTARLDTKANVVLGLVGVITGLGITLVYEIVSGGIIPLNMWGGITYIVLLVALYHLFKAVHTAIEGFKPKEFMAIDSTKAIDMFGGLSEQKAMENIAKDYAETAYDNNKINEGKAELIKKSFTHLMRGLVMYFVFIVFVLILNGV